MLDRVPESSDVYAHSAKLVAPHACTHGAYPAVCVCGTIESVLIAEVHPRSRLSNTPKGRQPSWPVQVEDNKGLVSKAMATQDPDYQPFLERLHRRMQQYAPTHCAPRPRSILQPLPPLLDNYVHQQSDAYRWSWALKFRLI